jgi:hypothetical protein
VYDVLVWLEPHSPQNFTPGRSSAPHEAHVTATGVPHSSQNLAVARTSALHD